MLLVSSRAWFEEAIFEFITNWEMQLSLTSKYHITKLRVLEFSRESGKGLGLHNEHASESVHSDFDMTWYRYKAPKSSQKLAQKCRMTLMDIFILYNNGLGRNRTKQIEK